MSQLSTILIVDDEPAGREILTALLHSQPYRLVHAASGAEALAAAAAVPPDLVLLDVMMPGMDGYEVCRRLRANPALAEVPVVLVTALDDRDSRLTGLEAGADDFVSKPFDRVELRARIRTITRLNRYRRLIGERERFAQVVEFAPDGILIVDAVGNVVLANPAVATVLEAESPAALIGRPFAGFVARSAAGACAAYLAAAQVSARAQDRLETILIAASGRHLPAELCAAPIGWGDQAAVQIGIRDITDRKRSELLEEERHHLAYELHDGLAQLLTSAHFHLQAFASRYSAPNPEVQAELDMALSLARLSVVEARRVIAGLRPTVLDDFGLAAALELHVAALRDEGWQVSYHDGLGPERLPPAVETVLFRITLEALSNVRKHAESTKVEVRLERDEGRLALSVKDWGRGFIEAEGPKRRGLGERIGLRGMRERAALLGGTCQIESWPGEGTTVLVKIPRGPEPENHYD